jgi:hypothetical protein
VVPKRKKKKYMQFSLREPKIIVVEPHGLYSYSTYQLII